MSMPFPHGVTLFLGTDCDLAVTCLIEHTMLLAVQQKFASSLHSNWHSNISIVLTMCMWSGGARTIWTNLDGVKCALDLVCTFFVGSFYTVDLSQSRVGSFVYAHASDWFFFISLSHVTPCTVLVFFARHLLLYSLHWKSIEHLSNIYGQWKPFWVRHGQCHSAGFDSLV